jgi:predicted secreted hydrolase
MLAATRVCTAVVTLSCVLAACGSSSSVEPPGSSGADGGPAQGSGSDAGSDASSAFTPEGGGSSALGCQAPIAGAKVSLPTDDTVHSKEPMEWWYWTGHVKTADGRWFGFEEVFFRVLVGGVPGHMVHSAVTDIDGNAFHHFSTTLPGDLPIKPNGFDFSAPGHTVKGGGGHDQLSAKGLDYGLDLTATSTSRATLQHGAGYTNYSFGGYTYYYSRERMDAQGTITLGSDVYPVTGTAWFDHQYGDIASAVNAGWDWFAFQLDDHRQMMLFVVRQKGTQVLVGASVTDGNCNTTEIPAADVSVTSLGTWKSPHTTCTYPAGWTVKVKDETFNITPYISDQEVSTSTPIYWEGASKITRASDGKELGRAYVELSGYCPPSQ